MPNNLERNEDYFSTFPSSETQKSEIFRFVFMFLNQAGQNEQMKAIAQQFDACEVWRA